MMALLAHSQGGPEVLAYESAPRTTPGDGEVQIAVHAAAITFDELTSAAGDEVYGLAPFDRNGAAAPQSGEVWHQGRVHTGKPDSAEVGDEVETAVGGAVA